MLLTESFRMVSPGLTLAIRNILYESGGSRQFTTPAEMSRPLGERFRLDHCRSRWRAVVDQWATLKADQTTTADKSFALAA
jgi:hypothetical protein